MTTTTTTTTTNPRAREPEEAIFLIVDEYIGKIIAYTGPYLDMIVSDLGSLALEESGVQLPAETHERPGFWTMRKGHVSAGGQSMNGDWDDPELSGEWSPSTPEDFASFGVALDGLALAVLP